jgi:hypothetical protein
MVYQQDSIEVVDFVTHGLRQQALGLEISPLAVLILGADGQCRRSIECREKAGERETAFLETCLPLLVNDRRIGEDDPGVGILANREVNGREPQIDSNLRRCEPESGRLPPGLKEVFDECPQFLVKDLPTGI